MSNVEPLVFLAGVSKFGQEQPNWTLMGPPSEETNRRCSFPIRFEREFRFVPVVHLGVVGFDMDNQDAARLKVRAENVHPGGFDVVLETWFNSKIWSVDVSWLAIGS